MNKYLLSSLDNLSVAFLYGMVEHLLKLINCLSILKVIHSGKIMLNSERNTYVLAQTDPSNRKVGTLCLSTIEQ